MSEPILMKLGMYIMTPEPISTTYFINHSHQSVFVCVSLGKHTPAATLCTCVSLLPLLGNGSLNTLPLERIHATIKNLWLVKVSVNITENGFVTQQDVHYENRRIVGRFVFCAVRVVSKENRRLLLRRTCLKIGSECPCWPVCTVTWLCKQQK
jgi:hypothetical protein